jgi:Type IV secretion system pilin
MDVAPILTLIGDFTDAGQKIAPALAAFGFVTSALQLLIAHVIGSPRGQELGKAGMIGSVLGLVAVLYAPQIMGAIHGAFGS